MGKREERREYPCVGWSVDQRPTTSIRAGSNDSNQGGNPAGADHLHHNLPRCGCETESVAANPEQRFRECGCHCCADTSKNAAGTSTALFENRHTRGASP